jgi:hypothetical protein
MGFGHTTHGVSVAAGELLALDPQYATSYQTTSDDLPDRKSRIMLDSLTI